MSDIASEHCEAHNARYRGEEPGTVHTTVRKYEGVVEPAETVKKIQEGFVPLIAGMPGFIEYQWVDLGQGEMLAISVFEDLSHALESNQLAAGWVAMNMPSLLPSPTRVETGRVLIRKSQTQQAKTVQ
jgi:hypothetical protein